MKLSFKICRKTYALIIHLFIIYLFGAEDKYLVAQKQKIQKSKNKLQLQ